MKRLLLGMVFAALVSLLGCKSDPRAPGASDDYAGPHPTGACIDHDGDGFGVGCALGSDCDDTNPAVTNGCYVCDHPSPGCPCQTEQARSTCGKVAAQIGTSTTCAYGESVCTGGTWSECIPDGKTVKTFDSARHTMGLAPAAPCGIACDPYCQQFPDTPDDTLSTPQGLLGTDAGLTLQPVDGGTRPVQPNGPMPGNVKATLDDAGVFADAQPDAIIYHELPPPTTAQDTVGATPVLPPKSVDVYFLENNAGTILEENERTQVEVPEVGGTMDRVKAVVPDARFGVGRFGQYDQAPWNETGNPSVVFEHVLTPSGDNAVVSTALQYAVDHNVEALAWPRPWMPAIFAVATTAGLKGGALPWVVPRASWSSPAGSGATESGACPAGAVGYPCFRPNALPITVVVTDTPSGNGPGGQYAFARNNAWNVAGAKPWSTVAPVAVTGNGTEATARVIDPTQFAIFTGNTTTSGTLGMPATGWEKVNDDVECVKGRGEAARNVFFTFTVAQRTWFHFDALGSDYNVVPYLYQRAGAVVTYIACNDAYDPNNLFLGDPQYIPASLDGVIDPGTYFLVIDGKLGAEGNYVLHVNAMPDGAAMGPVAEPNYDESVAAYNAIGGKVIGVDGSGYTCDNSSHPSWLTRNTGNALEKLLRDTGSVDGGGNPYKLYLDDYGYLCHAADPSWGQQLADAILGVSANFRANPTRANITAVAIDSDDATDFDGPGGMPQLTPVNIDDSTFVTSIATVATAQTMANCTQTQANQYVGCLSGTPVTFLVTFQTPATVPVLPYDQVFSFVIRILRDGTTVLQEIPVVIVVPAVAPPSHNDAWFVRDFDTTTVCPMGTAPMWGLWAWNSTTPGDSQIDFDVAVGPTVAALATAPDALQFSDPPGPMGLVGQAIGAHAGVPDTEFGATNIDATLQSNMRARDSKVLRLRAHLIPSTDRTLAPILQTWNLQVSCQPAE